MVHEQVSRQTQIKLFLDQIDTLAQLELSPDTRANLYVTHVIPCPVEPRVIESERERSGESSAKTRNTETGKR